MTLSRYTSKDLDKIFDAVSTYSVGYDDLFNRMLSYGQVAPQYPPYNVVKESDTKWRVEMALAGWSRDEIEISTETNVLCVKSKSEKDSEDEFIHRGVAKRAFSRSFNISDDVEVGDVTYKDGLLAIRLTKIVPEKQKRKVYEIGGCHNVMGLLYLQSKDAYVGCD